MSRLHEIMKGAPPMSKAAPKLADSPRKGNHKTRGLAKTARALGYNYTPTSGWRARKQGEGGKDYGKRVRATMMKQAKAAATGDIKGGNS